MFNKILMKDYLIVCTLITIIIKTNKCEEIENNVLLEELTDFRDLMRAKISYIKSKYNEIVKENEVKFQDIKSIKSELIKISKDLKQTDNSSKQAMTELEIKMDENHNQRCDNSEKELKIIEQKIRQNITSLKVELNRNENNLKQELKQNIKSLENQLKDNNESLIHRMNEDMNQLESVLTNRLNQIENNSKTEKTYFVKNLDNLKTNIKKLIKSLVKCKVGWTSFNQKCLKFIDKSASYSEAEQTCGTYESKLVTINSEEENNFVLDLAKNNSKNIYNVWIGAKRVSSGNKEFRWNNNKALIYSNWKPGEPNNHKNNIENYAEMYFNGLWNDNSDHNINFICEYYLIDEQIWIQ